MVDLAALAAAAERLEEIVLGIDEAEIDAVVFPGAYNRRRLALVLGIEIDAEILRRRLR